MRGRICKIMVKPVSPLDVYVSACCVGSSVHSIGLRIHRSDSARIRHFLEFLSVEEGAIQILLDNLQVQHETFVLELKDLKWFFAPEK